MEKLTVLSMEQALSLPYATHRFVQMGWRVIRVESFSNHGLQGDPNRYIGSTVVDDDRRSYFIAPNVGKEAIAINLKEKTGRDLLKKIIADLNVDVFCCNTLPSRYRELGIDYETLMAVKPDLIWASISAMGPCYPDTPGYDPALQAMVGYMELTGHDEPTLSGIPLIDLKAGDEVYVHVLRALWQREKIKRGEAIHVSMLQAAASWLTTTLPLLDFDCDPSEITRCGNEHRKFIPVNVYPTQDGYLFVAIGNDVQWQRLVSLEPFASLAHSTRRTNEGRHQEKEAIHREMAQACRQHRTSTLLELFHLHKIPHASIQTVKEVREMDAIKSRLTTTKLPNGKVVYLPPMAVDFNGAKTDYTFAPKYNQDTASLLNELGYERDDIHSFQEKGIIP